MADQNRPEYGERLSVPWTWWPAVTLIVLFGIFEVASGFNYVIYIPVTVFLIGFFVAPLLMLGLTKVSVEGQELRAGKDAIRVTELTTVTPLDAAATRLQLGPRADPAAKLVSRGWIKTSVMVRLANPRPTPYWLVSSRDPAALVAAIKQARTASRAGG